MIVLLRITKNRIQRLPIVGVFLLALLFAAPANAGVMAGLPDFTIGFLTGGFDFNTGKLSVSGWATKYTDLNGDVTSLTGTGTKFSLDADFDNGNFVSGGFAITDWSGNVDLLRGTLWQASTEAFGGVDEHGDDRNGGVIDFRANALTGDGGYHQDYGGEAVLLLSNLRTATAGRNFLSNLGFSLQTGVSDIARPVPEPATISCMLIVFVVGFRRRRQKKKSELINSCAC